MTGSGALLGSCMVPGFVSRAYAGAPVVDLDFRNGALPAGVVFSRASDATYVDAAGLVRNAGYGIPRLLPSSTGSKGLLLESAAKNLVLYSSAMNKTNWTASGGVTASYVSSEMAPDGSYGVFKITRPSPASGSSLRAWVDGATGQQFVAGSIWLRSPAGSGVWRVRVMDYATYQGTISSVNVSSTWKRYSVVWVMNATDTGAKLFKILENEPVSTATPNTTIYADPNLPGSTAPTLGYVLAWGAQFEVGRCSSSYIATNGAAAQRAADLATFDGSALNATAGRLTFYLPDGGRRTGYLLCSNENNGGVAISYTPSGWIRAKIAGYTVNGVQDVTKATIVQVEWSLAGVCVRTGTSLDSLKIAVARKHRLARPKCSTVTAIGMDGSNASQLGRAIGRITFETAAAAATDSSLPSYVPAGYTRVFNDDFADGNVARINENATGGTSTNPAWRSRYRQPRKDVINGEKQIYMDVSYAGTSSAPLGVQPFSMANSVLKIEAAKADPTKVQPYIYGYAYTSGAITTEYTFWQTYGYFEMRARMPSGTGFWPAFWLLPKAETWPPELDIFEGSGARPNSIHVNVIQPDKSAGGWIDQAIDTTDGFHVYGCEWTKDYIRFYIDGQLLREITGHNLHQDMYILANMALGSSNPNWIPNPDSTTPFPAYLEIDFIRAYKKS